MEILEGKIYKFKFDDSDVVVIQIIKKKERAEVSRDLKDKWNPFWVNYNELYINT